MHGRRRLDAYPDLRICRECYATSVTGSQASSGDDARAQGMRDQISELEKTVKILKKSSIGKGRGHQVERANSSGSAIAALQPVMRVSEQRVGACPFAMRAMPI